MVKWNGGFDAQVHQILWSQLDLDRKETFTRMIGIWVNCVVMPRERDLPKRQTQAITIVDMMSGKKLATIGVFRGFRIIG